VLTLDLGDMHRTAAALAVAGLFAHQLGHHGVPVGQALLLVVGVLVADRAAMAVASVGRADDVAPLHGRNGAGGHRFLAGVEVRGAFDDVLAQQVVDLLLEEPDLVDGPEPVLGLVQCDGAGADQLLDRRNRLFAGIFDGEIHVNDS